MTQARLEPVPLPADFSAYVWASSSRAVAERHGGTISVTSRPGLTEFVITLPRQALA